MHLYPTAKVYLPVEPYDGRLEHGRGRRTDLQFGQEVTIGERATKSPIARIYARELTISPGKIFPCLSRRLEFAAKLSPICSDAFLGPGVTIGEGAES